MANIVLDDITSGHGQIDTINANNAKIEAALNSLVLYRDIPSGETSEMLDDLDMNAQRILNLVTPTTPAEPATKSYVDNLSGLGEDFVAQSAESFTATEGQTLFDGFANVYALGSSNLTVYINGVHQSPSAYSETSTTSITLSAGAESGDELLVRINERALATDALNVSDVRAAVAAASDSNVFTDSDLADLIAAGTGNVTLTGVETLTNKTLTAPIINDGVMKDMQIEDTSADHQYTIVPAELTADRDLYLPLLTAADVVTVNTEAQTLRNKTLVSPVTTGGTLNSPDIVDPTVTSGDVTVDAGDVLVDAGKVKVGGPVGAFDGASIGYTAADGLQLQGTGTNDITFKGAAGAPQLTLNQGGPAAFVPHVTATTFEPTGDTSAGDNAAFGYTVAEGGILTGQGTTNDVTIKNDADATVIEIPTGTTNVDIVGVATAETFEPDGDTSAADSAAIGYTAVDGIIVTGQGSTNDVTIKNDADAIVAHVLTGTQDLSLTAGNLVPDTANKGIDFSVQTPEAGMTSQVLGFFEQGTFTPTVWDSTQSDAEGQTYSKQFGRYTRIGNRLFIDVSLTLTALGTLTGGDAAQIGGLPFTVVSLAGYVTGASWASWQNMGLAAIGEVPICLVASGYDGYTVCEKSDPTSTAGTVPLLISDFTATSTFGFSMNYEIA